MGLQRVRHDSCTLSQDVVHCFSITGKKDQWLAGKWKRNLHIFVAIEVKPGSSELLTFKVVVRKRALEWQGLLKVKF